MAYNKIQAQPLETRFWRFVDRGDAEQCWPWIGYIADHGYGRLPVFSGPGTKPKTEYAHRVSWQLANGPIPEALSVLHRCDNRKCVNPAHLFVGSQEDNMRDCFAKQRHPHGSKVSYAKLTESQVQEIRALYDHGGRIIRRGSLKQIAKRFGVALSTVSSAARRTWVHVGPTIKTSFPAIPFEPLESKSFPGRNGDGNPNAKLKRNEVDEMRRRHSEHRATTAELALEFGVNRRTVSGILMNRNWRSDIAV